MNLHACRLCAASACVLLLATAAPAVSTVYLAGGKKVEVKTIRWNSASKEYLAQPASGADVTMTFAQKEVERLEIDEPADIAQARELLKGNRLLDAVPCLERVIANYHMLQWDNVAREWLARIYVQNKEPAKAIAMVEELIAAGAGKTISAGLRQKYWEALVAGGEKDKVSKDLDDAIATGPRELVPVAQVMRANQRLAAGRTEDALDDYLRTILFFENAGAARAEALAKAAAILDKLNDPRGNELRQKLIQQYPDSDLAKKAAGKVS